MQRVGRPMNEFARIDEAFSDMGGVLAVISSMNRAGKSHTQIAQKVFEVSGVQVHQNTIRNWLKRVDGAGGPAPR